MNPIATGISNIWRIRNATPAVNTLPAHFVDLPADLRSFHENWTLSGWPTVSAVPVESDELEVGAPIMLYGPDDVIPSRLSQVATVDMYDWTTGPYSQWADVQAVPVARQYDGPVEFVYIIAQEWLHPARVFFIGPPEERECHDPFGMYGIAANFEEWILRLMQFAGGEPYFHLYWLGTADGVRDHGISPLILSRLVSMYAAMNPHRPGLQDQLREIVTSTGNR